ncbi:hypothetical protein Ddye_004527 [Dipteronia dyeriana]|uniref:C2 domain-containing protein n=1 Tax=Dipteronia dyeriana TaxID=168575 RepID=A0AAE0CXL9_9ROSI|nr:hypothetical protein Ddye_004527 [Dipteronia dyeriana]
MAMESGSLELKVMFCKDLKAFNFFQKLSVYAQVSIVSENPEKKLKQNQQQRTPADKEGDGNPEWKHEMRFDLKEISFHDCDHIFIHFALTHEGAMFGDKTIGEVNVPFKDLILEESNGTVRFVDYEVSNSEGKSNGVLSFSYKVNGDGTFIGTNSPRIDITGYPIAHHHHHYNDQGSGMQYPPSDVHSSQPEFHYPVVNSTPPPGVVYPSQELHNTLQQETVSTPQAVQYSSPRWQNPYQESYYPQPDAAYYPPPPPPVFSYPPPPMAHGAHHHHHHHHHHHPSPQFNPWQQHEPQMGFHSHSMPGAWGPAAPPASNMHPYDNGEMSPNGFGAGRDHRSSSWNGRFSVPLIVYCSTSTWAWNHKPC